MKKYRLYYLNDFGDSYDATADEDADGEWYRASEVDEFLAGIGDADDARDEVIRKEIASKDARIAELEEALKQREDQLRAALGLQRTDH